MTDLQKYRQGIISNHFLCEMFCDDLVEEIGCPDKALKWLGEKFVPAFKNAIEATYETDLPDCDIAKYAESCDTCGFCNGETKGE